MCKRNRNVTKPRSETSCQLSSIQNGLSRKAFYKKLQTIVIGIIIDKSEICAWREPALVVVVNVGAGELVSEFTEVVPEEVEEIVEVWEVVRLDDGVDEDDSVTVGDKDESLETVIIAVVKLSKVVLVVTGALGTLKLGTLEVVALELVLSTEVDCPVAVVIVNLGEMFPESPRTSTNVLGSKKALSPKLKWTYEQ